MSHSLNCVLVPIDKASNNVAFICKQFYALVISKELQYHNNFNNNHVESNTNKLITNSTKEEIIEAHKTFLAKYSIKLNKNIEKFTFNLLVT